MKVNEQIAYNFFENLLRNITPRVMDPWPLFRYTRYIQSLSMFICFLAFIVPEKPVMEIFKRGKNLKKYQGT